MYEYPTEGGGHGNIVAGAADKSGDGDVGEGFFADGCGGGGCAEGGEEGEEGEGVLF